MAITKEQAFTASEFHYNMGCIRKEGPRGGITERSEVWRRNGQIKTWKRDPERFQVPIKYGLRGYGYMTDVTAGDFHVPADCPLNDPDWRSND